MRTEEDLRDALDHLADQAPDPSDVRAALLPRSAGRPRRTGPIICTAVATACVAVAAVVVPHVISDDRPGPVAQDTRNTAWSQWVDLNLLKSFKAVDQRFSANRQDYELVDTGLRTGVPFCQLQLHRNGDFDPSTIPAGSPSVDLGGHKAWTVTSDRKTAFMPGPPNYSFPLSANVRNTIVWQPVAGVWALLSCESLLPKGTELVPTTQPGSALKLAGLLSPPTDRLGSPFKLGELPKGLSPHEVRYHPADSRILRSGEEFTALLSDGNPATGYVPRVLQPAGLMAGNPWDAGRGDDLSIRYDTGTSWNQLTLIRGDKPDGSIHGMKAFFTNQTITYSKRDPSKVTLSGPLNTLRLEADGVAVVITSYAPKPSKEQLLRIAETMELTQNPKDPTTWFDAATAIP
ncbi:hypothetical protein ACIA58_13410 [Kribbella sp. NPDC051586]|uniref:hypothetical protein n=1 Tax=Kribbella sp. NPDC051586 TaxID=3364118 RepID=UPI0037A831A6